MEDMIVILCTVPDDKTLVSLSEGLVNLRLAACVSIVDKIKSIYFWKGEICRDEEKLLIIKTIRSKENEVFKYIEENHPYEVAERISFSLNSAGDDYLKWANDYILGRN